MCAAACVLVAQYGSGTILGTVTDATGAVVPNVKVAAKNTGTGEVRSVTTDETGNYQINALQPGTYDVSATAASFRTAVVPNLVLRVNTQTRVDFSMQLGTVSDTVEVAAATPLLQTNTAALGTAIDNRTILEAPLNARNFFDL